MKYLFGRAILSACFLISFSLMAKDGEKSSYSLFYMKDRYRVEESRNIFRRKYKQYGTIFASQDRYFYKKTIKMAWGLGTGLGYNQGNLDFISGTESDIIFRLYTLLVDASIAGEIQPVSFLKLMLKVGPSFMGLYQSRNDLDAGEPGKNIYQIGVGGFAQSVAKIGLGELFPSLGTNLYGEYNIYGLSLNVGVRYQYYGGFRNSKIERVDGVSYMMGFSFEYK